MQVVHADALEFKPPRTNHRETHNADGAPRILFKRLLVGDRDSPQNFEWMMVRTHGLYHSPRHRHNFDQIRVGLVGAHGDGKTGDVHPGEVGYYPEGVHYTLNVKDDFEILLLQFGGASGAGFIHFEQLYEAYPELAKLGEFRDGVFFRNEGSNLPPGVKRNQDGYEAMWEYIRGKRLEYPRPRYREPILINPKSMEWVADPAQPGVSRRALGHFTEREIAVEQIAVNSGAEIAFSAPRAPRLLFLQTGAGTGGDAGSDWPTRTAVKLETGESARFRASEPSEWLGIQLPVF